MVNKERNKKGSQWRTKVANVDEKGVVEIAVNAFGNEDSDGDISMPGSFTKTLNENFDRVKWFLNHNKTQLLGVPLKGVETPEYLQMTARFNMKKQMSLDTYYDYQLYAEEGKTLEHSIGVDIIQRNTSNQKQVTEYKMWEFSTLTNWGANENTPLLSLKDMGGMSVDQMNEQVEFISKALKLPYSEERLASIEKSIGLLTKIIKKDMTDGSVMVCCPYCGETFDYNSCDESTFEQQVLQCATDHARWMVDNIVYNEMQKLKPEIQAQVQDIISLQKMQTKDMQVKGIENFANYVRCPKCWTRVYKFNAIEPADATQTEVENESDDMTVKAGKSTFSLKSIHGLLLP